MSQILAHKKKTLASFAAKSLFICPTPLRGRGEKRREEERRGEKKKRRRREEEEKRREERREEREKREEEKEKQIRDLRAVDNNGERGCIVTEARALETRRVVDAEAGVKGKGLSVKQEAAWSHGEQTVAYESHGSRGRRWQIGGRV